MARRDLIVIGAALGGFEPLRAILSTLPPDFPAALAITVRVGEDAPLDLASRLAGASALPVTGAADGVPLEPGHVYVAQPGMHLAISPGRVRMLRTPHVNSGRPSIDVLFRSAARNYGARVAGVLLSGCLDDGSFGLAAIEARGGVAIVQDPGEAEHAEMPRAALARTVSPYRLAAADIAPLLCALALNGSARDPAAADGEASADATDPSPFVCPSCGGRLSEGPLHWFHCRVGHGFAPAALLAAQSEAVDDALWEAARALEEQADLAARAAETANSDLGERLRERELEARHRAAIVREILTIVPPEAE